MTAPAGQIIDRPSAGRGRVHGHVLLLEDEAVIAMDLSDMLEDMGAERVHICFTVAEALAVLESHPIRLALLDINLGTETSLPVAQYCEARGVRHVLATGYGREGGAPEGFPETPLLLKPFGVQELHAALAEVD